MPVMSSKKGIEKLRQLGQGAQGTIWHIRYHGMDAAAKYPHDTNSKSEIRQMVHGAKLQRQVRHPNILLIYDIIKTDTLPIIVMGLAPKGDLRDLQGIPIPKPLQLRIASEVASALNALHTHEPPIAHRDVKGANILFTEDLHVRLSDFDMALLVPSPLPPGLWGTPGFIAPEVIASESYDHQVDIFSFGSVLYEITHGELPFSKELDEKMSNRDWTDAVMQITKQGLRPPLDPTLCPPEMQRLINDCWAAKPEARPSMTQVMRRLEAMRPIYR